MCSKLHTISLPQLANTSGIIVTPLPSSIFLAPGVVGPFALSMINFALILFALPLVITLYTATGIKISQFVSNKSLLVIASRVDGYLLTLETALYSPFLPVSLMEVSQYLFLG